MAVIMQGVDNKIIVQAFPQIDKFNKALVDGSDSDAYFAARKVDELDRKLTENLKQMRSMIAEDATPSPAPSASNAVAAVQSKDASRLNSLRQNLKDIYQQQLAAQQALDQFVGETLYSAAAEGRSIMSAAKKDNTPSAAAAAKSGSAGTYTGRYLSSHGAPVAAVSMPQLPKILNQTMQIVNDTESKMRPVVRSGIDECFKD